MVLVSFLIFSAFSSNLLCSRFKNLTFGGIAKPKDLEGQKHELTYNSSTDDSDAENVDSDDNSQSEQSESESDDDSELTKNKSNKGVLFDGIAKPKDLEGQKHELTYNSSTVYPE
jgi:hypothetical protein